MKKKILTGMMVGAGALYLYKKMNKDMMHEIKDKVKNTYESLMNIME